MSTKKLSVADRAKLAAQRRGIPESPGGEVATEEAGSPKPASSIPVVKTAPGMLMNFMAKESDVMRENEHLRELLAKWDGATPARKLDPTLVKPSKFANRAAESYENSEFAALQEEIKSAGGNTQAILVRPVGDGTFETIFGHRRHRACLNLGLAVLAIAVEATDLELFEAMDRENRHRADLRPFEQGEMYRLALDEGLYPSLRRLSEAIGAQPTNASLAVRIARLPAAVLKAFNSPLEIQYRWSKPLSDLQDSNESLLIASAERVIAKRAAGETLSAHQIFAILSGQEPKATNRISRDVPYGAKTPMKVTCVGNKITFEVAGLDPERQKAAEEALVAALTNTP
jgi:ParB family chromosome partitioning protein